MLPSVSAWVAVSVICPLFSSKAPVPKYKRNEGILSTESIIPMSYPKRKPDMAHEKATVIAYAVDGRDCRRRPLRSSGVFIEEVLKARS
jgi:hypothetical protein